LIPARTPARYAMDSAVHPYRQLPTDHEVRSAMREERILYAALCVVGAIPLGIALLRGGGLGVEATLGLLMALAGLAGLIASARRPGRRSRP
jgi:hypothetical protein